MSNLIHISVTQATKWLYPNQFLTTYLLHYFMGLDWIKFLIYKEGCSACQKKKIITSLKMKLHASFKYQKEGTEIIFHIM